VTHRRFYIEVSQYHPPLRTNGSLYAFETVLRARGFRMQARPRPAPAVACRPAVPLPPSVLKLAVPKMLSSLQLRAIQCATSALAAPPPPCPSPAPPPRRSSLTLGL
jgi:hypothetical protein